MGSVMFFKIYDKTMLLFETSQILIDPLFPITISPIQVPISVNQNYTIEASILGRSQNSLIDGTLFIGANHTRLVPGSQHHITISMRYSGKHFFEYVFYVLF